MDYKQTTQIRSAIDNGPNGPTGFLPQTRVSIKRSPAFYKNNRTVEPAIRTELVVKRSSLKRKPGVEKRTSRPKSLVVTPTGFYDGPDRTFQNEIQTWDEQDSVRLRTQSYGDLVRAEQTFRDPEQIRRDILRCYNRSYGDVTLSTDDDVTVAEALRAPLPSGPAPKKPPRTFTHDICEEQLPLPLKMTRSRTEPHISRRNANDPQQNRLHQDNLPVAGEAKQQTSLKVRQNQSADLTKNRPHQDILPVVGEAKQQTILNLRQNQSTDPTKNRLQNNTLPVVGEAKQQTTLKLRQNQSADLTKNRLDQDNPPVVGEAKQQTILNLRQNQSADPTKNRLHQDNLPVVGEAKQQTSLKLRQNQCADPTKNRLDQDNLPVVDEAKQQTTLKLRQKQSADPTKNRLDQDNLPVVDEAQQQTILNLRQNQSANPTKDRLQDSAFPVVSVTDQRTMLQLSAKRFNLALNHRDFERKSSLDSQKNGYEILITNHFENQTALYPSLERNRNSLPYLNEPLLHVLQRSDRIHADDISSFSDYSDTEADMCFKQAQLVQERKCYIQRISSAVGNTAQKPKLSSMYSIDIDSSNRLFDSLIIASVYYDHHLLKYVPYIQGFFPANANLPEGLEQFCFPDSSQWSLGSCRLDPYTIVLTDNNGNRQFGYCQRKILEESQICLTFCLLSKHRASGFYNKLLSELTARYGRPGVSWNRFLETLHSKSFPVPGENLELFDSISAKPLKISRPLDIRLEDMEFCTLFSKLDKNIITAVLGTLLLERKVLFVGRNLSVVSACVQAVQLMLYPFTWQHTLVPVLPKAMAEICSAPTPYIMGILTDNITQVDAVQPDQGILVDLDSGELVSSVGDESSLLPRKAVRSLHAVWELTEELTENAKSARHALFSESFLRFFVELCGHYAKFIKTEEGGKKVFEKAGFIEGHSSQSVRLFLEWFTETAMFSVFIESRLQNPTSRGLFEQKIMERSIQTVRKPQMDVRHTRTLGRKIKNIGDKLREMSVF